MAPVNEARQNQHPTTLLGVDRAGSVLTTQSDHQRNSRSYTVYGDKPSVTPEACKTGFVSELLEALGGHYILGNGVRTYAQTLMRFRSPDALSPFGRGGINCYMYCSGDPVNFIDRTGRMREPPTLQNLARKAFIKNSAKNSTEQFGSFFKATQNNLARLSAADKSLENVDKISGNMDPESYAKFWRAQPPKELDIAKAQSWQKIAEILDILDSTTVLSLQNGASPETGNFFGGTITGVFPEHLHTAIKTYSRHIPEHEAYSIGISPAIAKNYTRPKVFDFTSYSLTQAESHIHTYLLNFRQDN
ncbi:RHS repeat-associated core domain-containing protein [Pseudomonas mosselii]|uniref:RHS repeat-associated core domain-containing protein n=1 Tax=unclassified Pseudomonas TaxID=196821 RepID=UPI0020C4B531|nr:MULTISPECIES: RHS repeat-associated core domain-containing protein [unclassified Pseudomonas]MCP8636050.1 RHS repeat-associated core domain-containing protein [Pseudomonas sp. DVZ6]MDD7787473.1 RHS repeat-associated core domain-containing protein [Pseudomonas sp. DVZ24]